MTPIPPDLFMNFQAAAPNADHLRIFSGISDMFREGVALVDAASLGLTRTADELATMQSALRSGVDHARLGVALTSIHRHVADAAVAGDNLLVADALRLDSGPLLVRALARDADGSVTTRDIQIERAALAIIGDGDDTWPLDRLEQACAAVEQDPSRVASVVSALEAMTTHVGAALSRLSIIKARLDLQSSFVAAVAGCDVAPIVESPVDLSDARALALQTRRLLGGQSLDIGNSNRQLLQALFARR